MPLALFILCSVGGCGTMVPQMEELWDSKTEDAPLLSAGGALEFHIKEKVYCELRHAAGAETDDLPKHWGVQVTLDLEVDETGALNPGVAFSTSIHAGSGCKYGSVI